MSTELKEFIELGIKYINTKMNLKEISEKYKSEQDIPSDRTLLLSITSPSGQVGFTLDENFKIIADRVINPTVAIKLDEDTFWAIITKKLSFAQAFFDGSIDMIGEHLLRDFVLLNRLFNELAMVLNEVV